MNIAKRIMMHPSFTSNPVVNSLKIQSSVVWTKINVARGREHMDKALKGLSGEIDGDCVCFSDPEQAREFCIRMNELRGVEPDRSRPKYFNFHKKERS